MANNIPALFKYNASEKSKDLSLHCKGALNPIKPIIKLISSSPTLSESQPERIVRKKDGKEKELIQKHSQLEQSIKPVLKKALDSPLFPNKSPADLPKLIGQLNGDRMISHTRLEEIPIYVGTQIAEAYLEETNFCPKLNDAIKQLAQTASDFTSLKRNNIHEFGKKFMQGVLELQEGKSFFALGACVENKQCCSIIYEFCKNKESYDLFVYMIGKESGVFGELNCEGGRSWVRPFMHFKEIPPKELFFTGETNNSPLPDLFQAIVETFPAGKGSNYAVLALLGKMEPYLVPSSQEMKGFLSAAHSHTNAWREISGILFRYLGRETYRKIAFDLKISSLIEGYQLGKKLIEEDSVEGSELREVLKAGAKNILNNLVRYQISNVNYKATALDLLNRIESVENEIAKKRVQKSVKLSFDPVDECESGKSALSSAKNAILPCKIEKHTIISKTGRFFSLEKPEKFAEQLRVFNEGYSNAPEVEKIEIEHFVQQFAIPKNPHTTSRYWTKIPVDSLSKVIQGLETILKHYDVATRKGEIQITPKEANTVFSLFVIVHFLALRLDKRKNKNDSDAHPSRLSAYPLFFPGHLYDSDPFLIYTSPVDFEKREQIRTYCNESRNKTSYSFDPLFDYNQYYVYGTFNDDKAAKEGTAPNFFHQFACAHDDLEKLRDEGKPLEAAAKIIPYLSPDTNYNPLKRAGLGYLPSLAYAAFLSHQFSGYIHLRNEGEGTFTLAVEEDRSKGHLKRISPKLSSGGKEYKDYEGSNQSQQITPSSKSIHPFLSRNFSSIPGGSKYGARNRAYPSLTDEAELLNSDSTHPVERRALQPGLQPHHMISDYKEERIHLLADPEEQTLFELEFFRSVVSSQKGFKTQNYNIIHLSEKKEWFPLQEELKQTSFVKECKAFIHAGVEHYYDLQLGGRPNVFATLFLIRLACRIERFTGKPLIDSLKYMHNMLKIKNLTDQERSALSIHLVLAYSEQKQKLTDLEVKEVFEAWVYYQNTPLEKESKNPLLEKETTSFVHTLIPSAKSEMGEESFQRNLLSAILKQLGMGALPIEYKIMDLPFPTIRAEKGEAYWEINLLTGRVSSQQGILARGAIPKWIPKESLSRESDEIAFYKRLFNGREHTYFQMGSTYHFEDPCLGPMRVVNGEILSGLQRYIDSNWYQYVYPKNLTLPKSLLADHTHWIPVENPDHLLICDFATGEKRAYLTEEGTLHPFENGKIDHSRTLHSAREESLLEKIDQRGYILCTLHENQLEKITFSRFHSLSGEELSFEMKDNKALFGLNRKYHLNEQQQSGLLGGISQYLLLVDSKGEKQKVLIPRRPIATFTPLTSHHILSIKGEADEKDPEFTISQKGSATFLEYDLEGGRLLPLSPEANLQLAYLYLAQREYVKAKELIAKISYKQPLSRISTEILRDILKICEKGDDTSPESAAVVLWAYRLEQNATKRVQKASSVERPDRAFAIYSRYQQTIPAALEYDGEIPPAKKENRSGGVVSAVEGSIHPLKIKLPHTQAEISTNGSYIKNNNSHAAKEQTAFLDEQGKSKYEDEHIILSTPYGKGYATGGFFRDAYAIALQGSEEERDRLRFRLELMEGMRETSERRNEWTILQLALRLREKMPPLPAVDNVKAAWEYLENINNLIKELPARSKKEVDRQPVNDPIPLATQLKAIFPEKKKAEKSEERLLLVTPDKSTLDEGFLQEIFPKHLKPIENSNGQVASQGLSFAYDSSLATSEDEKGAESAICKEFAVFQEGYNKGRELNQKRTIYAGSDCADLQEILRNKSSALSIDLHNLEGTILEIANKRDPQRKENFSLLTGSKVEQEISLKTMIWHFLGSDKGAFKKANPYLEDPTFKEKIANSLGVENKEGVVIEYLYNLIGLYLTTAVYKQRLERAQSHIEKILKGEEISESEKRDLVQKVAYELNPETLNTYLIAEHPEFLVFEYYTGFYIRSDQVEVLNKFLEWDGQKQKLHNQLIPLRPGGGKTAVIAAIRMKIAAGKGRLPLFCTTTPQYASASQNLRKTLKECFDQDMEEIDFSFDEIYEKCEIIEERMKRALERGDFLPVKSEMLLCLQLKMVTAAFAGCGKQSDKLKEINTLRRILELIKEKGELLLDEIDLILSVLREMNFPQGEKQHVAPERIDLIRELFLLFVSGDLKELIKLEENRQTLLTESDFKEVVAQAVAKKFTKESNRLLLHEDYHLSFYRYITGKMNSECQKMLDTPGEKWGSAPSDQDLKDLAFLGYLRELHESKNPEKEEAAHQIALVKQMMLTVLPSTFQKMVNRNYGRGNDTPGEVRPFEGNEPTNNYFGYIYEWIAYHFQTVLQAGMGGEQISLLAAIYREGAASSLKARQLVEDEKSGEILPPEALEFKNLTGIALEEVDNPEKLKIAVETVNKSVEAKLQLEAETASAQVIFHPHRVTANGFSLANMSNPQGMSATLNNAHCFEDCLADAYKPQPQIVGEIAHLVTERIQTEKKQHLHFVRLRTLDGILDKTIVNHPEGDRIGMLLDSGALFKDVANLEVAKGLRIRLKKPVLFFRNGILTLLPLENDKLRFIKTGTRVEDIQAAGVGMEECVVYLAEKECTGSDFVMPYNTIGIMTCDETILDRAVWQTILRLRQIAFEQRVEFIIPVDILPLLLRTLKNDPQLKDLLPNEEELKKSLESDDYLKTLVANVSELKIFSSLLNRALLNQAIAKAKEYGRSRKQKIDSLFEQTLLSKRMLLERELTQEDLNKLAPYKKLLELPQSDSPYDQFGALEVKINSIEDLTAYGERRLRSFREAGGSEEEATQIAEQIKLVIKKAEESPWLLKTTPTPGVNELGMEVDILNEVTKNTNVDQEINNELLQELTLYENAPLFNFRPEKVWGETEMSDFLSHLSGQEDYPKTLEPLPVILEKFDTPESLNNNRTFKTYNKEYKSLFNASILATPSWIYTTEKKLSVFHRLQRPAENILLIEKEGSYQAVVLTSNEATQFKYFLREEYKNDKFKNITLVTPYLTPLEENPAGNPPAHKVSPLLFLINVFNGNITYLEENTEKTQEWLKEDKELKLDFLRLRVAKNPVKKKRFFESPLFGSQQGFKRQITSTALRERIAKLTKEEIVRLGEEDKKILWMLSDNQLHMVDPNQVPLLHPHQMSKLRDKELVSRIPEAKRESIVEEQFPYLSQSQKSWFSAEMFVTSQEKKLKEEVDSPVVSPEFTRKDPSPFASTPLSEETNKEKDSYVVNPEVTLNAPIPVPQDNTLQQVNFQPLPLRLSYPFLNAQYFTPPSPKPIIPPALGQNEENLRGILLFSKEGKERSDSIVELIPSNIDSLESHSSDTLFFGAVSFKGELTDPLIAIRLLQNLYPNIYLVGTLNFIGKEGIHSITIDTRQLASLAPPSKPLMLTIPEVPPQNLTSPSVVKTPTIQYPPALPFRDPHDKRAPPGTYPTLATELLMVLSLDQVKSLSEEEFPSESPLVVPIAPQNNPPLVLPDVPNPPIEELTQRVPEEQGTRLTRCQVITRVALIVIGILCLVATIVGIFATVGLHVAGAPQFMVTIAKSLPWDFTAYILTSAGPAYLFGLGIYALIQRRRREAQNLRV